jgi:hypothetical protein
MKYFLKCALWIPEGGALWNGTCQFNLRNIHLAFPTFTSSVHFETKSNPDTYVIVHVMFRFASMSAIGTNCVTFEATCSFQLQSMAFQWQSVAFETFSPVTWVRVGTDRSQSHQESESGQLEVCVTAVKCWYSDKPQQGSSNFARSGKYGQILLAGEEVATSECWNGI